MPTKTETPKNNGFLSTSVSRNWLIALVVLLLITTIFALGAWTAKSAGYPHKDDSALKSRAQKREHRTGMPQLGSLINDNRRRLVGAVTSVSGDEFTLAGWGATTKVRTTDSTQYRGGNEVKVNDTVIALGENKGGAFEAVTIIINP